MKSHNNPGNPGTGVRYRGHGTEVFPFAAPASLHCDVGVRLWLLRYSLAASSLAALHPLSAGQAYRFEHVR